MVQKETRIKTYLLAAPSFIDPFINSFIGPFIDLFIHSFVHLQKTQNQKKEEVLKYYVV